MSIPEKSTLRTKTAALHSNTTRQTTIKSKVNNRPTTATSTVPKPTGNIFNVNHL